MQSLDTVRGSCSPAAYCQAYASLVVAGYGFAVEATTRLGYTNPLAGGNRVLVLKHGYVNVCGESPAHQWVRYFLFVGVSHAYYVAVCC